MKIIIYGSKYGTTKQYAMELSKKTNIKAESYDRYLQSKSEFCRFF